jgi:hypothetical protein
MSGLLYCVENGRFENPYVSNHYVGDWCDRLVSVLMSRSSASPRCGRRPSSLCQLFASCRQSDLP